MLNISRALGNRIVCNIIHKVYPSNTCSHTWRHPDIFVHLLQRLHFSVSHDDVIKWKHFRVTGHLKRSFDVFFDLGLNTRLSKQSRGWWFKTPSRPLWRHSNENNDRVVHVLYTHFLCLVNEYDMSLLLYILISAPNNNTVKTGQWNTSLPPLLWAALTRPTRPPLDSYYPGTNGTSLRFKHELSAPINNVDLS